MRKYFCGVSRHSRVWGRHSPTSFPRGAKPQNCGFWHRGRNLLCNCRRLPLSGFFVHRTDRTGLAARCGRSFFLSAKDTFQRPPATRWTGIFQNFSLPSTTDNNQECQTPGQKFLPHLLLQLERVKMAENRTGQTKKAANLFQDLLLSLAASRRQVFSFYGSSGG